MTLNTVFSLIVAILILLMSNVGICQQIKIIEEKGLSEISKDEIFWIYKKRGEKYFNNKKYKKALSVFKKILDKYPSDSRESNTANIYIGRIYESIGEYSQAIVIFEKISNNFPEDKNMVIKALKKIAKNYSKLGQEEKMVEYHKKIIEKYPDNVEAENSVIEIMVYNKDSLKNIELCNEWINKVKKTDNLKKMFKILILSYIAQKNHDKTLEISNETIERFKDDRIMQNWIYNNIAGMYRINGNYDKAMEYYDKIINDYADINPKNAYKRKINIYVEKKNYNKAHKTLDEIIEKYSNADKNSLKPKRVKSLLAESYLLKADIYFQSNDYKKSLACYDELIKRFPDDVSSKFYSYYGKAKNYWKMGDYKKSLEYNEKIFKSFSKEIIGQKYITEIEESINKLNEKLR